MWIEQASDAYTDYEAKDNLDVDGTDSGEVSAPAPTVPADPVRR